MAQSERRFSLVQTSSPRFLCEALEVPLNAGFATTQSGHSQTCRATNERRPGGWERNKGTTRRIWLRRGLALALLALLTPFVGLAEQVGRAAAQIMGASASPSLGELQKAMLAKVVNWELGVPGLDVLGNPYPHDAEKQREAMNRQNIFLSHRFVVDGNPDIGDSWLDTWIDASQFLVDSSEDRWLSIRIDPFRALAAGVNLQTGLTFLTNLGIITQQQVVNPLHTTITGINPGGHWGWLIKILQGAAHESIPCRAGKPLEDE